MQNAPSCSRSSAVHVAQNDAAAWNGSGEPITDYVPVRSRILPPLEIDYYSFLFDFSNEIRDVEIGDISKMTDLEAVRLCYIFLYIYANWELPIRYCVILSYKLLYYQKRELYVWDRFYQHVYSAGYAYLHTRSLYLLGYWEFYFKNYFI